MSCHFSLIDARYMVRKSLALTWTKALTNSIVEDHETTETKPLSGTSLTGEKSLITMTKQHDVNGSSFGEPAKNYSGDLTGNNQEGACANSNIVEVEAVGLAKKR